MKSIVFVLFCVLLSISCSSPDRKAKKLIKNQLKESLHDWKSYEPVKFGTLDSTFSTYLDKEENVDIFLKYIKFKEEIDKLVEEVQDQDLEGYYSDYYIYKRNRLITEAKEKLDSMGYYGPLVDSIKENFIPEFNGWELTHSFRANNASGNKVIGHYKYFFDKDITIIKNSEDISEDSNKEK